MAPRSPRSASAITRSTESSRTWPGSASTPALLTGTRAKIEAFVDWAWDGFTKTGGPQVLDRGDAAEIDWEDDPAVTSSGTLAAPA